MRSIKPGRGPSKISMVGGIAAALFGIFWCILAVSMGAWFMVPFGIIFVGMAIYNAIYHHHNVTSEDRYSIVDIVDEKEEPDPLNEEYGRKLSRDQSTYNTYNHTERNISYCPYCGSSVDSTYKFCPECGHKLPN
ncbi:MAG: zinc-ribbon domain-containing protein [Tissierellia bacterium]|nr:zinc-ribbon domain-containing protein [Tissierellia bacterium]